jgi:hypothetical protein
MTAETKALVEELRAVINDDHARGCEGRQYTCSCGYDDRVDEALRQAAARLDAGVTRETSTETNDADPQG